MKDTLSLNWEVKDMRGFQATVIALGQIQEQVPYKQVEPLLK